MEILLANCEKGLTPVLKTIIVMDPFDAAVTERASKCTVEILSLKDVEVISKSTFINMVPLSHMFMTIVHKLPLNIFLHFRLWEKIIFESQL